MFIGVLRFRVAMWRHPLPYHSSPPSHVSPHTHIHLYKCKDTSFSLQKEFVNRVNNWIGTVPPSAVARSKCAQPRKRDINVDFFSRERRKRTISRVRCKLPFSIFIGRVSCFTFSGPLPLGASPVPLISIVDVDARNVKHFWIPKSAKAAPLVIFRLFECQSSDLCFLVFTIQIITGAAP